MRDHMDDLESSDIGRDGPPGTWLGMAFVAAVVFWGGLALGVIVCKAIYGV